jgi:hypothetical protein
VELDVSLSLHVPRQVGRPALESHREFFAGLFRTARPSRFTWRALGLVVLATLGGALVSLLRVTGTGALQSIWEEDARDILDGALNTHGWGAIWRPVAGYFVVGPRLLGQLASLFPLSWAAAVLSISSALIIGLLVVLVYCATEPFFPGVGIGRIARLAVSVPILIAPVAENRFAEVYDRPVCLHFFAMYAMFWVLLWSPATVRGRVAALLTTVLTGVSTILVIGLLPLAAVRLIARRDRYSIALSALVFGGSLFQALGVWTGVAVRGTGSAMHLDPYWVLRTFAGWGLPTSVLGFRATRGISGADVGGGAAQHWPVVALAWLLVVAVVLGAWLGARRGWLRPQWTLAAAAGIGAVWLYALTAVANGDITYRYLVPVSLLLYAGAVALLWPAPRPARPVVSPRVAGFAVLVLGVLVAAGFNYRWTDTNRAHAPLWTDQVRLASQACRAEPELDEVIVRGGPLPWWSIVRLPCHELIRPAPACVAPHCTWLDPPVSVGLPRGRYSG